MKKTRNVIPSNSKLSTYNLSQLELLHDRVSKIVDHKISLQIANIGRKYKVDVAKTVEAL